MAGGNIQRRRGKTGGAGTGHLVILPGGDRGGLPYTESRVSGVVKTVFFWKNVLFKSNLCPDISRLQQESNLGF